MPASYHFKIVTREQQAWPRDYSLDRARHGRLDSGKIDTTPAESFQDEVLEAFFALLGEHAEIDCHTSTPLALPQPNQTPKDVYRLPAEGLSICGDWLRSYIYSVEDAYLSISVTAGQILGQY